jgi:hypothetical protein
MAHMPTCKYGHEDNCGGTLQYTEMYSILHRSSSSSQLKVVLEGLSHSQHNFGIVMHIPVHMVIDIGKRLYVDIGENSEQQRAKSFYISTEMTNDYTTFG